MGTVLSRQRRAGHPLLLPRPERLAQHALEQLAARVAPQGVDHVHALRALVVCQPLAHPGDQLCGVEGVAGARHHAGLDRLAPPIVGHAGYGRIARGRVSRQRVLHLGGIQVSPPDMGAPGVRTMGNENARHRAARSSRCPNRGWRTGNGWERGVGARAEPATDLQGVQSADAAAWIDGTSDRVDVRIGDSLSTPLDVYVASRSADHPSRLLRSSRLSRACNAESQCTGFEKEASIPASRQALRSWSNALEVKATIGTPANPGIRRIWRVASMPSMTGICRSMRISA